jgi:hypothetical protein
MERVICAHCGKAHDISKMEPNLKRPEPLLSVPEAERGTSTYESKDACILFARTPKFRIAGQSRQHRYFLRVLLPFMVEGRPLPFSWGAWIEIGELHYERVGDLWDDPNQHHEPPFGAVLASNIWGYPPTEGLPGLVYLQDPDSIPKFILSAGSHQFVVEQHEGVTEARVWDWLDPILHGGN